MKTSIRFASAILFFTAAFISCTRESFVTEKDATKSLSSSQLEKANPVTSVQTSPVIYNACGMAVNVFSPMEYSSTLYSFAIRVNGENKLVGVGEYPISFTHPDKFVFEGAGYADNLNRVKLWRIKRTDGKYLTASARSIAYLDKLTGSREAEQIFLLSSLGDNLYKVLLPKFPVCKLLTIGQDIDTWDYIMERFDYNINIPGNTNILILAIKPVLIAK